MMGLSIIQMTSRGKEREKVFSNVKDRERLKAVLERTKEKYGYLLYTYMVMDNHLLY